ncbi:hypothetical protein [Microlunatus endophyticus]
MVNTKPHKIAIVGIENSHATHIIEYLNVTTEEARRGRRADRRG